MHNLQIDQFQTKETKSYDVYVTSDPQTAQAKGSFQVASLRNVCFLLIKSQQRVFVIRSNSRISWNDSESTASVVLCYLHRTSYIYSVKL